MKRALPLVLIALVLGTASATTTAQMLSDPANPSTGYYVRTDDNAVVEYRADGTIIPVGISSGGTLFSHEVCPPTGQICTEGAGNCIWARPAFSEPQTAADAVQGACVVVRGYGTGTVSEVDLRAAVRLAQLTSPTDNPLVLRKWTVNVSMKWHGEEGPLLEQPGRNPSYPNITFPGCTMTTPAGAVNTAHLLADCVWQRTGWINVATLVPPDLVGTPTGFELSAVLQRDPASGTPITAVLECYSCFQDTR